MIYADNAATTKMSKAAIHAMLPYMEELCGNPSSLYAFGQKAKEALDGLPAHKLHCSVLAEEASKKAVRDYYDKNGIAYDPALFPDCGDCHHCGD